MSIKNVQSSTINLKSTKSSLPSDIVPGLNPWVRNSQWLTLPTVTSSEQKIVGLYAIFENANFIAFTFAGDYTVDWGDGVIENFATGVTAYHEYSYTNTAFNGTLTDRGYKQAIVTITPQAGQNLTTCDFYVKHNLGNLNGYVTGWLDLKISAPNCTSLIIGSGLTTVRQWRLEQVEILSLGTGSLPSLFRGSRSLQNVIISSSISVTDASNMFQNCYSLVSAPLFNTASCTSMLNMFTSCYALSFVPLYNTASCTNTADMFSFCENLKTVPLFNTVNAQDMSDMFFGCSSLESVPLFNTENCTNMNGMFETSTIKEVPLFNTAKVTDMGATFQLCEMLKTVPLFNTANVTTMLDMFQGCTSLVSVPLFNTAKVTNMVRMFDTCNILTSVPLFNTANVTNMNGMFSNCQRITTVPLFNTANVTNMISMFSGCQSLSTVPALNFNAVPSSANSATVFATCTSLESVKATGFRFTFSVSGCKLSANSLNEIYTNLPTVTAQTITVTSNYGITGDNPAIATAKGWTVSG